MRTEMISRWACLFNEIFLRKHRERIMTITTMKCLKSLCFLWEIVYKWYKLNNCRKTWCVFRARQLENEFVSPPKDSETDTVSSKTSQTKIFRLISHNVFSSLNKLCLWELYKSWWQQPHRQNRWVNIKCTRCSSATIHFCIPYTTQSSRRDTFFPFTFNLILNNVLINITQRKKFNVSSSNDQVRLRFSNPLDEK